MDDDQVSLYRCRKCRARMYLATCEGHYARCVGGAYDPAAFERGPVDQHAKPGATYKPRNIPYTQQAKRRKPPKPDLD